MTQVDLETACGLRKVLEYILDKQLRYIGHVGRYPSSRLETCVLGCLRCTDDPADFQADLPAQNTLAGMWWHRVKQVMAFSDIPTAEWATRWAEFAQYDKGDAWREAADCVRKAARDKVMQDTWVNRHSDDREAFNQEAEACISDVVDASDDMVRCSR